MVNFGDCLVRSEGAIALAAVLREGLPIVTVSSPLELRPLVEDARSLTTALPRFCSGSQPLLWRDLDGGGARGGSGSQGQNSHAEAGLER